MLIKIVLFILLVTVTMMATIFLNFKMQYSRLLARMDTEYQQLCELFDKRSSLLKSIIVLLTQQAVGKESEYARNCDALLEQVALLDADDEAVLDKNAALHRAVDALAESAVWAQFADSGKKQLVFVQEDIVAKAESYNSAVRTYNTLCQFFPASVVAKLLRLKLRTEYITK